MPELPEVETVVHGANARPEVRSHAVRPGFRPEDRVRVRDSGRIGFVNQIEPNAS